MRVVLFVLGWLVMAAQANFELEHPRSPVAENPDLTETVWRAAVPPGGTYDRIGLHRYAAAEGKPIAVLFYLPGTNMNGELGNLDERHNLWLYLARRGVAVYALDYRTHFVPNEPIPEDTSFMQAWDMAAFVSDAKLAVEWVRRNEPQPLFVAGFSRGAAYAYALAGQVEVDGLVILDGYLKQFETSTFDRDAAMEQLEASGQWASVLSRSRGWQGRTEMMTRAAENPDGPAMGKFDSIGSQLTETLYYAWGKGGLANPVDGISRIDVLARAMVGYDRLFPMIQNVEGRSIAMQADDPATPLDDHFGEISAPLIYFGATNLSDFLMHGLYSATRSGSNDVTLNVLENHGHLDVLVSEFAADHVYGPTLEWIRARVETPPAN